MIAIRTPEDVESAVWISKLNLRLPADHGWIVLPMGFWSGDAEDSEDLEHAFEQGLIEVRITGQRMYPAWYLNVIAVNVRTPSELLEDTNEAAVLSRLGVFRKDAHPALWAIACKELYMQELTGRNRSAVVQFLQGGNQVIVV